MKVGFIGLGQMGLPIAARIGLKIPLHIYDSVPEKVNRLKGILIKNSIPTIPEQMSDKEIIFTCLPSTLESGSIIRKIARESSCPKIFVDLSSGCFRQSREIAIDIGPNTYIDAPISGGPKGATAGTLTSIISAESLVPSLKKLIESYSNKIILCGDIGNGNAIKSVNNYLNVSHLMLASDTLLGLKQHGVNPEVALEAINNSSGRSLQTQERIPNEIMSNKYNYGFKLHLMCKDVKNAQPLLEEGIFYRFMSKHLSDCEKEKGDYTTIVKKIEQQNNEYFI